MNGRDLCISTATKVGCSQKDMFTIFMAMKQIMFETLGNGEPIFIQGLFELEPRLRVGNKRVDVITKQVAYGRDYYKIYCKPHKKLYNRLKDLSFKHQGEVKKK